MSLLKECKRDLQPRKNSKGKDTIGGPKGQWSQVYFAVAQAMFIQSEENDCSE